MIKHLLLLGFVWLVSCLPASAEVLTNGLPIATANSAMQKAGYMKTGLDMLPKPGSGEDLQFWDIGQGVLIVGYSKASQRITGMTLWLADERPKALRRTFDFEVTRFETSTGATTIQTKKDGGRPSR